MGVWSSQKGLTLAATKSAVEHGQGIDPAFANGASKEDFIKAGIALHSTVDKLCTAAYEGDVVKLNQQVEVLSGELRTFGTTAKGAASLLKTPQEQADTLTRAMKVLENSEKLLHEAYNKAINRDSWASTKSLIAATNQCQSYLKVVNWP